MTTHLSSQEPPSSYKEQIALLRNSTKWANFFSYFALIFIGTTLILGLVFMVMLTPLLFAWADLQLLINPAYQSMGRILEVKNLPKHLAKPPKWLIVYSVFWLAVQFGFVVLMVRLLFQVGFWNQNIIYLIAKYNLHP